MPSGGELRRGESWPSCLPVTRSALVLREPRYSMSSSMVVVKGCGETAPDPDQDESLG